MRIQALSVIPEVFAPYVSTSILGRAQKAGTFSFEAFDLRDWTHDKHRTVDDAPFGGGPGMLMCPAPLFEGVQAIQERNMEQHQNPAHVIFFTPAAPRFDQKKARELAQKDALLFVCGRYEGMDERAFSLADECLSLGDFVLTGGELAAMALTDAVVRLLPGALGNEEGACDESFSVPGLLEYEQYTRPADFQGQHVPEVLLSGDHKRIEAWRLANAIKRTAKFRPDMLHALQLTDEMLALMKEKLTEDEQNEVKKVLGNAGKN